MTPENGHQKRNSLRFMFHLEAWPLLLLIVLFLGAAAAVWLAGQKLSDSTDALSSHYGLGQALGGLILLAIVTNLPELAITTSAALGDNLGIAVGNILGGIALQTVVLVVLDVWGVGPKTTLTYHAASLVLVLEGAIVIGVLALVIMGTQMPASVIFLRLTPGSVAIAAVWIGGLLLVNRAQKEMPWQAKGDAPGGQDSEPGGEKDGDPPRKKKLKGDKLGKAWTTFGLGALVTLICGVLLERSGDAIAGHIGMNGVLFGATFLAASTSIPEVSTGLASIKIGDTKLAFSDIFGGNAFLPVLFLLATLLSGKAVLPQAHKSDIYLTGLGIILTSIYMIGLILRPRRQILRMGVDSFAVLVCYILGIVGIIAVGNR